MKLPEIGEMFHLSEKGAWSIEDQSDSPFSYCCEERTLRNSDSIQLQFRLVKFEPADGGPLVNKDEMKCWLEEQKLNNVVHATELELRAFGATFPSFKGPKIHALASQRVRDTGFGELLYAHPMLYFYEGTPMIAFVEAPKVVYNHLRGTVFHGWSKEDLFLCAEKVV